MGNPKRKLPNSSVKENKRDRNFYGNKRFLKTLTKSQVYNSNLKMQCNCIRTPMVCHFVEEVGKFCTFTPMFRSFPSVILSLQLLSATHPHFLLTSRPPLILLLLIASWLQLVLATQTVDPSTKHGQPTYSYVP